MIAVFVLPEDTYLASTNTLPLSKEPRIFLISAKTIQMLIYNEIN